jgi:hypothetical protein
MQWLRPYRSNKGVVNEWWMERDLEESGSVLILRYYPAFTWREWGKQLDPSVTTEGLRAEICTRDLPIAKEM